MTGHTNDLEMESIGRALDYHKVHCTVMETGSCDGPTDEEFARARRDVEEEHRPRLFVPVFESGDGEKT